MNEQITIYVFIDASNVWNAVKSTKKFIEYKTLKDYFRKNFNADTVEIFYYDAYPQAGTRDYDLDGKHKFLTYLKKGLGFTVRKKELKRISVTGENGESIIEKGNMDVEITIDAMHNIQKYTAAVFFSGDADFLALVNYLKNRGKKVYIFSSKDNISHELKTGGNGNFDLKDIHEIWGKDLKYREKDQNKTTHKMTQNIQQLREEFKQKIDILNNYLFAQGLSDPMTRIQQLSFLFFLKMLEEQDIAMENEEKLTGRKHKSIFAGAKDKFRWSRLREKTGQNLYKFVRDEVFEFVTELHNGHDNVRQVFEGAKLLIPDEATLKRTIEIINDINFSSLDTDVKGDLYEYLLQQINSAGKLGAFLTPRHIIRTIVEMVNPKIGETILDPACGTGGFLINAHEWIKFKNSDPKNLEEREGRKIGYGDKLNKEQWQFLSKSTFHGYDVGSEMQRLALMNLILHGLEGARILRKDTVAGSENENDLKKFDVVLTNPPFAGLVDAGRIKPTLPVKSNKTQVLFLGYVINSLKPHGRAGIILPEGSLFGTNKDDKDIRRFLLENTKLEAVVSMPAGVFQPYAGVKTSFLIFKKKSVPKLDEKEKIWFFDMRGDGSSLSAAKKFGPQYKNDVPKLLALWTEQKVEKPYSWLTSVKEIAENDYILSANTYSPYNGEEEVNHREPREILKEIESGEKKLSSEFGKIKKLL